MAKGFATAFTSVVISCLGIGPAAALDWSGKISDIELATANAPTSAALAIFSPFSLPSESADVRQQNIFVVARDTGAASITQAVVSLSFTLHVTYP